MDLIYTTVSWETIFAFLWNIPASPVSNNFFITTNPLSLLDWACSATKGDRNEALSISSFAWTTGDGCPFFLGLREWNFNATGIRAAEPFKFQPTRQWIPAAVSFDHHHIRTGYVDVIVRNNLYALIGWLLYSVSSASNFSFSLVAWRNDFDRLDKGVKICTRAAYNQLINSRMGSQSKPFMFSLCEAIRYLTKLLCWVTCLVNNNANILVI